MYFKFDEDFSSLIFLQLSSPQNDSPTLSEPGRFLHKENKAGATLQPSPLSDITFPLAPVPDLPPGAILKTKLSIIHIYRQPLYKLFFISQEFCIVPQVINKNCVTVFTISPGVDKQNTNTQVQKNTQIAKQKYQKLVHNRCARCNLYNLYNT